MKKILIVFVGLLLGFQSFAQSAMTSKEMIGLTPFMNPDLDISSESQRILGMKLRQFATKGGFAGTSGAFYFTVDPVVTNKQMTPTAPSQFIVDLDLTFYIFNSVEGVIINEMTVPVKGVNRLEQKAYISAINSINSTNPTIRKFMESSRNMILSYYTTKTPNIIAKAKLLAEKEQYKEATMLLASIPDYVDQYPAALDMMTKIYQRELELETIKLISLARAYIIEMDYHSALSVLLYVNPISPNAKDAYVMVSEIENKVEQDRKDKSDALIAKQQKELDELTAKLEQQITKAESLTADNKKLQAEVVDNLKKEQGSQEADINAQIIKAIFG